MAIRILGVMTLVTIAAESCTSAKPPSSLAPQVDRVAQVLGVKYPYRIEWMVYRDGGTVGAKVLGSGSTQLQFCYDGRGRRVIPGDESWRAPRRMYLGGTHPDEPTARPVEVGGPEEEALAQLLGAWVSTVLHERADVEQEWIDYAIDLGARLRRRVVDGPESDSVRV